MKIDLRFLFISFLIAVLVSTGLYFMIHLTVFSDYEFVFFFLFSLIIMTISFVVMKVLFYNKYQSILSKLSDQLPEKLNRSSLEKSDTLETIEKQIEVIIEERKKEIKKKYNVLRKKNYSNDELYSLKIRFRSLLNQKIRKGGFVKKISTLEFLGCDWESFKQHIELQFKEGMSWENRDLWDLDHIIPISEGKTFEDIVLLSHFTNFQPLWKHENIKKSNKW